MKILHLDDSPEDLEIVQDRLVGVFPGCELTSVLGQTEFKRALDEGGYDLVLSDYHIPGFNDLDALRMAQEVCPGVPFIFCSGTIGEDKAIEAMREGATDYVLKQRLDRLVPAVGRALKESEERRKRREVEEAFQKIQATLREQNEILTRARDSIIILDLEDRVKFWNEGAAQLLGWKAAEVVNRVPEGILESDTRDQKGEIKSRLLSEGGWSGPLRLTHRDGRTVFVEARVSVVRNERGEPQARLVILTDVTEKKALEEQLFRAQRLESLGLLASGISHDLNNILAPILMAAPLLRKQESDAGHLRLIDSLERSAARGADMVQQILAFARGVSGEPQLIQLKHVIRDLLKLAYSTFPQSIKVQEDIGELWPVRANPTQMHQLLLNLCVNARDAMPAGGTLRLSAENKLIDVVQAGAIRGGRTGPHVVIEVADTGTGIPPQILERIWEPFFTTKGESKGTGLGLSTVRGIVENHHGFIELRSEAGKGTSFRIYLPADEALIAESASRHPFEAPRGQNEVVLIVDDDPTIRELLGATLTDHGYRVLLARDATEAIEHASHARDIACVITDFGMPEIDGLTLLRVLKRLLPAAKLILVSGHADPSEAQREGGGLIACFVAKPFRPEVLLGTIRRVLSVTSA
ncbi:hybrid sensor histidine kinase/response regulator [Nibricoccus aquaticus]|uniref:histidine kinase n=1 Tax=Nibricoccus aquaticus TaxID=2576891 RepID=A0A290QHT1_9BACT|nr:response regulator [Nibricoccus aquaticus]ATC64898.1 hybrid sensor histidine kinase/response regulator [Nibricoccus aquaticus]